MNILRVFAVKRINFMSSRPLLSAFFVRAARALLCSCSLKFEGLVTFYSEDRR
jgi:hypothetical protein